jgi:NAD(P)-dependent dehydrogenase (short-subunit alcohol dehydrogenase family)
VAAPLREAGAAISCYACNVAIEAQVAQLVSEAISLWGRLDIAVNNAGISPPMKALVETQESDLDLALSVNVKGTFFGLKHQIAAMLNNSEGGTILNVASSAGIGGAPKLAAYAAAKHAVVGLTRTAALEYARKRIRVNAICPFYTKTPMVTESELKDMQEFLAGASPMKRLGLPQEIVAVMMMLCNPENSYMTGQAIAVDGGVSAL